MSYVSILVLHTSVMTDITMTDATRKTRSKKKVKHIRETLAYESVPDPIWNLHEYSLDVQNNHIYMFPLYALAATPTYEDAEPGVEFTMSNRFIMNARLAMVTNPDTPLVVHQKTCGGDWSEGMAIFDTLLSYPCPTTTLNYTHARSMSSLTFQAATKRVMMPHSVFMFHDGSYGDWGTVKVVRSGLDFYDKVGAVMLDIYSRRMKQQGKFKAWSEKRIKAMLREEMDKKEDVYLTAQETIDWGLADEMFDGNWEKLSTHTPEQIARGEEYAGKFFK